MSEFDDLNQASLEMFGQPLTYTVNGAPVTITGIPTRPGAPLEDVNTPMHPRVMAPGVLRVSALTTAVAAAGIAQGATLALDGKTYKVGQTWPDDADMTVIEHRA